MCGPHGKSAEECRVSGPDSFGDSEVHRDRVFCHNLAVLSVTLVDLALLQLPVASLAALFL